MVNPAFHDIILRQYGPSKRLGLSPNHYLPCIYVYHCFCGQNFEKNIAARKWGDCPLPICISPSPFAPRCFTEVSLSLDHDSETVCPSALGDSQPDMYFEQFKRLLRTFLFVWDRGALATCVFRCVVHTFIYLLTYLLTYWQCNHQITIRIRTWNFAGLPLRRLLLALGCQQSHHAPLSLRILYSCGAGAPLFPLVHLLPHLFPFLLFPFFHWLYLFSSFVHPFPFYQNSPIPFPGRRS